MYSVKEIFYTLQGEGFHSGRAAVFLRFAGCNLWTGKEKDREKAICKFCDTQFVGTDGENGGKFKEAIDLAREVRRIWDQGTDDESKAFVVCSGGEPGLQLDAALVQYLHEQEFEVAIETNGTISLAGREIDWICVSPKADAKIIQDWGHELKLVYPQVENRPEMFSLMRFDHFFLSPRDQSFEPGQLVVGYNFENPPPEPTQLAVEYCMQNPKWKLSLQTHKMLGLK